MTRRTNESGLATAMGDQRIQTHCRAIDAEIAIRNDL